MHKKPFGRLCFSSLVKTDTNPLKFQHWGHWSGLPWVLESVSQRGGSTVDKLPWLLDWSCRKESYASSLYQVWRSIGQSLSTLEGFFRVLTRPFNTLGWYLHRSALDSDPSQRWKRSHNLQTPFRRQWQNQTSLHLGLVPIDQGQL